LHTLLQHIDANSIGMKKNLNFLTMLRVKKGHRISSAYAENRFE
jgi:hypothetical protein